MNLHDLIDPQHEELFEQFFACVAIVKAWRAANSKILAFHKKLEGAMAMPCEKEFAFFALKLPSGRYRPYFKCRIGVRERTTKNVETGKPETRAVKSLHAAPTYSSPSTSIYGGLLCENIVQSLSRDIMAYSAVAIEQAEKEFNYLWSVHDELIFEVPEARAQEALAFIEKAMCDNKYISSWTKGLPLLVEAKICHCYGK
jgi:hypothetical protein